MKRILLVATLLFSFFLPIRFHQLSAQTVSEGQLKILENFQSDYIDAREIYVWVPDGYTEHEKYAVLYMHDGQMLWDSTSTWNQQEWMMDEISSQLMKEKKTKPFMIVGIPSHPAGKRFYEYYPEKSLDYLSPKTFKKSKGRKNEYFADDYLHFLVKELKPYIDQHYPTFQDPQNTFIMGSSMGGLISLYALCEYPETFGGAACLSTHTPMVLDENWIDNIDAWAQSFREYLRIHLPLSNSRKIYMDRGDQTLDAVYPIFQDKLDTLMIEKGWTSPSWISKVFPGHAHQERDWAKRVHLPLEFLLAPSEAPTHSNLTVQEKEEIRKEVQMEMWEKKKNTDWANFSKYEEANQNLQENPKVVLIGDSITEMWYRTHPEFFEKNHFAGRGISGQTTAEILARMQADVICLRPKYVIINMGINDIARNNGFITKKHMLMNIKSMCELCRYNGIEPILSTTLPSNNIWRKDPLTGEPYTPVKDICQLNQMIQEYAENNEIRFIDFYSKMEKDGGLTKDLSEDGTHPTLKGYKIMEEIVLDFFN